MLLVVGVEAVHYFVHPRVLVQGRTGVGVRVWQRAATFVRPSCWTSAEWATIAGISWFTPQTENRKRPGPKWSQALRVELIGIEPTAS